MKNGQCIFSVSLVSLRPPGTQTHHRKYIKPLHVYLGDCFDSVCCIKLPSPSTAQKHGTFCHFMLLRQIGSSFQPLKFIYFTKTHLIIVFHIFSISSQSLTRLFLILRVDLHILTLHQFFIYKKETATI